MMLDLIIVIVTIICVWYGYWYCALITLLFAIILELVI
jgi:hypothetical protein